MENKTNDKLSEDLSKDTTEEITNEESKEASKDETKEITTATPAEESNDSTDSGDAAPKKKNYTAFIIEGIVAVIAILVIAIAVLVGKKGGQTVNPDPTFGTMPAIPEASAYNQIDESTVEENVANNTMIKLKTANGGYVYVANYKDSEYLKENIEVKQEDIDDLINTGILANFSSQEPITERTDVQLNDTIAIDYVGKIDGVAFEGGTGSYDLTIGSHSFIDTFEEQLIGAHKGDTVEVNVTFPENYGKEELNGKPAVFTVTINDLLYTAVTPELTDEIVTEFFSQAPFGEEITTVDGCIEYCTNYLKEYNTYNFISKDFYASTIDQNVVNAFYNETMQYYQTMATSYGTDLESLLASSGSTLEDVKADVVKNAAQSAVYIQVITAIADDLNIKVSDDDILAFVKEQGCETVEEYAETYGNKDTLKYFALEEKVMKALIEAN